MFGNRMNLLVLNSRAGRLANSITAINDGEGGCKDGACLQNINMLAVKAQSRISALGKFVSHEDSCGHS